jgi:hypothetical protein
MKHTYFSEITTLDEQSGTIKYVILFDVYGDDIKIIGRMLLDESIANTIISTLADCTPFIREVNLDSTIKY